MGMEIEVVESSGGEVVSDEVYGLSACASCGAGVADAWPFCTYCGEEQPEGGAEPYPTCSNGSSEPAFFLCTHCGRLYVPVQVRSESEDGAVEWRCCPGCLARLG